MGSNSEALAGHRYFKIIGILPHTQMESLRTSVTGLRYFEIPVFMFDENFIL